MIQEREDLIEGLFPESSANDRPFKYVKDTIFISCRVHPGEVSSSYVLQGIMDLLTDEKSLLGRKLRRKFCFKIIPMLNPDGVSRGYYRLDTLAYNLNRCYLSPSIKDHPSIYASK